MILWHYTCDHGREALGQAGELRPASMLSPGRALPWFSRLVWLTDLEQPDREALGLTSWLLHCDRTSYRYRVTELEGAGVEWWPAFAREIPRDLREQLEAAPGARPAHWYVTPRPIPAELS